LQKRAARNLSLGHSKSGSAERVMMNVLPSVRRKWFILALLQKAVAGDSTETEKKYKESEATLNLFLKEGAK
jgi:hypothetical protein